MPEQTASNRTDIEKNRFLDACKKGDFHEARLAVRSMLEDNDKGRILHFLAKQITQYKLSFQSLKNINVALLSSYSTQFLHDALTVTCFQKALGIELYEPGFNQFRQAILNSDSGLYQFEPDVLIVSVLGESLCPDLYYSVPSEEDSHDVAVIEELSGLIGTFRKFSSAPILLQNLLPPTYTALGVGDANLCYGQRNQVRKINSRLIDLCSNIFGVYIVDYEALVFRHGALQWHDERMRYYAQLPMDKRAFLPLVREFVKFINILTGGAKKCIVVDLDNTLWGGILGEDGLDGIKLDTLYPGSAFKAFQQYLVNLHDRGILLAVASKNNLADVDEAFEKHPHMVLSKDHFAVMEVGWNHKSESLRAISQALNIGLEHIVFIDDSPVECAEVSRALPMIETLVFPRQPERFAELLSTDGLFDLLQFSKEDTGRAQLYKQRVRAESLRRSTANLDDFYRSLEMEITIEPVNSDTLQRTAQLTQKTNQFNLATGRYSEADIQARIQDGDWHCRTVTVRDRFGDNGIVGVILANRDGNNLFIDTFLLSCRVIGRTVETAMLAHLCDIAEGIRAKSILGTLIPTAKNAPIRAMLPNHGFEKIDEQEGRVSWQLDLTEKRVEWPEWFRVCSVGSTKTFRSARGADNVEFGG